MGRNNRKIIIYVLMAVICSITIAYSALSTRLTMTGIAKVNTTGVWNIMFTNIDSPVLTGSASSDEVKLTATSITFLATLTIPNDSITYIFDVSNKGILDAELSSITLIDEEYVKSQHISYSLTYANGSTIELGDTLEAGQTQKMKLIVSYDDVSNISSTDIELNLGATLIYSQKIKSEGDSGITNPVIVSNPNLAQNGNLEYSSNAYFSQFTYNNGELSYTKTGGTSLTSDHYLEIDPTKKYEIKLTAKSNNPNAKYYIGLISYDIDRKIIATGCTASLPSTLTTLARDLNNGDTKVYLNDISNWYVDSTTPGYRLGFMFWNYKDSTGYQYPVNTYSRNVIGFSYSYEGLDKTNNVITLKPGSQWNSGTIPAGTQVSMPAAGQYIFDACNGGYNYGFVSYKSLPNEYQTYSFTISGFEASSNSHFLYGTKYVNLLILFNYNENKDMATTVYIKNFEIREV